jgi:MFS family permease
MNHLKIFFSRRDSIAIGIAFFVMGFLFGNWATMIPYVKHHFGITDGILGLILLCMPLGCLVFNFYSAILVQKFGMKTMTIIGMVVLSIAYAIPLSLPYIWIVPIGLILAGICVTILNIAMNMTAAELEKSAKIYIMSTCHGMFSLGLMVGSLMRSFTLPMHISEPNHMFIMCGLGITAAIIIYRTIMSIDLVHDGKNDSQQDKNQVSNSFVWPSGALLTMIIISLCTNVTEGSMADWASVYMTDIVKTTPIYVGWGLSGYSAMMALGRFMGDAWIPRFGQNKILVWGSIMTFAGLSMAIALPFTTSAVIGFGMVGMGVSLGSPILYASAARYPDIPNSGGLALMNTFSMAGFLLGPVVIGFISDISNLAVALGFVAVLAILWFVKARSAVFY